MTDDAAPELDELTVAILRELASAPGDAGMSLPRLGKHLGLGVSVLMRALSAMGHARIGGVEGPGWVRVTQEEDRWTAALTEAGRAVCARRLGA
jgi:FdhD protein